MRIVKGERVFTDDMKWKLRAPATVCGHQIVSIGRATVEHVVSRGEQFVSVIDANVGSENASVDGDEWLLFKTCFVIRVEGLVAETRRVGSYDASAVWSPLTQRVPQRSKVAEIIFGEGSLVEIEDGPDGAHWFFSVRFVSTRDTSFSLA